jgi:hypothetical protein
MIFLISLGNLDIEIWEKRWEDFPIIRWAIQRLDVNSNLYLTRTWLLQNNVSWVFLKFTYALKELGEIHFGSPF